MKTGIMDEREYEHDEARAGKMVSNGSTFHETVGGIPWK
jgi:hypothetical protein